MGAGTVEIVERTLKRLKINLLYDPAGLPFGICPEGSTSYSTETCSAVISSILLMITRKWKQNINQNLEDILLDSKMTRITKII